MKILQMDIKSSCCTKFDYKYNKLFQSQESAMQYLNTTFPGAEDRTEYWRNDVPQTFFHSKPQYDSDGGYDYPIESTIELEWVEVL